MSESQEEEMFSTRLRKLIGLGAVLGLAAAVSAGVLHAGQGPGPGFGRGMRGGPGGPGPGGLGGDILRGLGRLDLTDAQREQVRTILQQHRAEFEALRERGQPAREALGQAIQAEPVDEALIRERHAAVAAVEADGAVLAANVRAEVFQILTPEQQQKARDLRAEMQKRMQERRNRMQERLQQRQQRNPV
jgi:protein CpxP